METPFSPEHQHLIKILLSAAGALLFASCTTACGLSTPGGYVVGTTGYLAEVNRGRQQPLEQHTAEDRAALARIVAERGGR